MAITDIARQQPGTNRPGPDCTICMALETLPPDQAEALNTLMADKRWRYSEIAYQVKNDPDHPLDILPGTYARHAKGGCREMRQAGKKLR